MGSASGIRAGQAFVELLTDSSKLEKGLRAAAAKLKAWGSSISAFGKRLAGIGTAIAGPMVGAAVTFSNSGDAMAKMAARTGISVEALSALAYAADLSGVATAELESGIRRMQRTIYEAATGSRSARDALAGLGLTVEQINGLPVEGKFKAIAERIAAIGSPTQRAALAMEVFGRGGAALLPLLNQGTAGINQLTAEADRLGITMSTQDATAAVEFKDSMTTLWAVLKRVRDHIGAALAPALMAAARWLTDVAGRASGWAQANQGLLLTIFKLAVGVIAAGLALMVLGKGLALVGTAITVFSTLLGVATTVLAVVKAAILALMSPIGLVIGAVAALGAYYLYSTGQIDKATTWLGEGFAILKDDALTAFGGIADALATGNIGLAAEVLWALLKLEWARGTGWLSNLWTRMINSLLHAWSWTWAGIRIIANTVWHGLTVGWIETTAALADAWYWFVGIFKRTWEEMKAFASRAWLWIKKLVGKATEEQYRAGIDAVNAAQDAAVAQIKDEKKRRQAANELERQRQRDAETESYNATIAGISRDLQAREQALDADTRATERANAEAVDAAKAKLAALAGQAKEERRAKERAGPEAFKSPEEVLGKLKDALAGVADELEVTAGRQKVEARGTFSAAALLGLAAGGPQDRIATATERTARNTDRLLQRAQVGGLTFQ